MAPTSQTTESIFDILYADTRKIGIYLSQIDPNGILTGIKATAGGSTTMAAEGGASVVVATGKLSGTNTATEGAERAYDPSWVLPITLLNRLDELGFIHRGIESAGIGSLILLKGYLRLIDVAMLKDMWPIIGKHVSSQAATQKQSRGNRKERRAAPDAPPSQVDLTTLGADMLRHLPHAFELHHVSLEGFCWATLDPASLMISASDIALKHGAVLPGEWHMLAVLDARPGFASEGPWADVPQSQLTEAINQLLILLRGLMGRPSDYHGVTPLILFREIVPAGAIPPDQLL